MSRLPFPRDVCHGDGKHHSEALTGPVSGVWLMSGQSWHCPRRDAVGQTSPGHCPAKWELGHWVPPMEGALEKLLGCFLRLLLFPASQHSFTDTLGQV